MKQTFLLPVLLLALMSCNRPSGQRTSISLNGEWQLAIGDSPTDIPEVYNAVVPVPGLVDLAKPQTAPVELSDKIYWHRREFVTIEGEFSICNLKINKAKYLTRIYINGKYVGENPYCFTPTVTEISGYLNPPGEPNEIVIAVGCKNNLPATVADGSDFEKDFYYPGIYDDVMLIYSGTPYVNNVQCVPMVEEEKLRVQAEFTSLPVDGKFPVTYRVTELASGRQVSYGNVIIESAVSDFEINMDGCRLWTPEDPFLYVLEIQTSADNYSTRFGMRSFRFDKERKLALLNGEPYFIRGTNICIYRFFDDPVRKDLPWKSDWATRLHEQFKSMHWNSIRYCIGFPPERWYEIADSLGFLIADEFPIWFGNNPEVIDSLARELTAEHLVREYSAWMRERWNHPCVVIWDAQNESVTDITGDAMQMVRQLDLSGRPWENGWAAPRVATDPIESHPYLYTHYFGHRFDPPQEELLSYFFDTIRIPHNDANERDPSIDGAYYENPVLINEYCWLWMNRDGSPTRLTEPIFNNAFGDGLSTDEMYEIYARHLAIMTEYWRAHRTAAGVQHFCGLGYSRPDEPRGETCDNFIDIDELVFEPGFEKYVRSSFAPVGLMLDVWDYAFRAGSEHERKLFLINDLEQPWEGPLELYFERSGEKFLPVSWQASAEAFESKRVDIRFTTPEEPGTYDMVAELDHDGETVRSVRQVVIR
jgi:beta-galactosidase